MKESVDTSRQITPPSKVTTIPSSGDAETLRRELFEATDDDDLNKFVELKNRISPKSFCSRELKSPKNMSTVLNYALENRRYVIAKYLIENEDQNLLMEDYITTTKGVASPKSNLHILAEKENFELTKLLLNQIKNDNSKQEFLKREVLTELEGQRPRHLSCMHLAALHGHTNLVDLFRSFGVSVNVVNNKKDTPVLWASRGNHIETVRYLIKNGADLHLENDKGSTPLYWAVRYGFKSLVRVLIQEGRVNLNQERKLGFLYPIVLASALGYDEIVKTLIESGAEVNAVISNSLTSLHVAAAEGHYKVVQVLIDVAKIPVDINDANGNSPLLLASKSAKVKTMRVLIEREADIEWKNKFGLGIWDYTLNNQSEDFLKAVLKMYKRVMKKESKESTDETHSVVFPRGKSPLHIAALSGSVDKLQCLLKQGVDPKTRDLNGNTFFHLAARDDKVDVLQEFLSEVSVNDVNDEGDTALHIACKYGQLASVDILLSKFKLDSKNKQGMTPLHEAVFSDAAKAELVRKLVEYIIKASTWSLVDAVENAGNTALHLASKKGRPEIIAELSCLNPKIMNHEGDSPFHLAAKSGIASNFEAMLSTFNKPEIGIDINQRNRFGDSCLHICSRLGDFSAVATLIDCGADLSMKNEDGNTVIHVLVEESSIDPSRAQIYLQTYRCIVSGAAKWWCMSRSQQLPCEGSDLFFEKTRKAMLFLTAETRNNEGSNSIEYAIKEGALYLLEEILNTPSVYKLKRNDKLFYDITSIVPGSKTKWLKRSNSVKDLENFVKESRNQSYLSIIVSLNNDIQASRILDISPINEIVCNYWKNYQWIYVVLLCIHITYMILFTIFVMPVYGSLPKGMIYTDINNASGNFYKSAFMSYEYKSFYSKSYGCFLIWPVLVLVFELFFTFSRIWHYKNWKPRRPSHGQQYNFWSMLVDLVTALVFNLGDLISLMFGVFAIAWYVSFAAYVSYNIYLIIVSLVFLFGWIYLINFTKAIEGLHVFTIMLKYIILRNITRFIGIYVIFLLGCSMAFNALFQIHPDIVNYSPSLGNTLFSMINTMLGLGTIFSYEFDKDYESHGGYPPFIKSIYIFYVLVSTVILMSLLIAMMTDTYTNIQSKEASTWRVGSLRLALQLEEALPMIKPIFKALCTSRDGIEFDVDFERWLMDVTQEKDVRKQQSYMETDEMQRSLQRLESNIERIQNSLHDVSKSLELLMADRQSGRQEGALRNKAGIPKFYNVVNKIRSTRD